MKHLAEYRDAEKANRLATEIRRVATRPWAIMEVCGGQTHSIIRHGVDQLLPPEVDAVGDFQELVFRVEQLLLRALNT